MVFFLFFISSVLKYIQGQCLGYDPLADTCKFCSYNSYYSNIELRMSNISPITPNECQAKLNQSQIRNILITNVNFMDFNMSNFAFDAIYYEFDQGLLFEWIQASPFFFTKCNFYLSKGNHFIKKGVLENPNLLVFQRLQIDFSLQPLYCTDFFFDDICVTDQNPTIMLKTTKFPFAISDKYTIQNITFDAINMNYNNPNDSCLRDNFSVCCDLENIKNSTSFCYFDISLEISNFELNFGLFQLDAIYDDPNMISPVLTLINVKFMNFFWKNKLEHFSSIIILDKFGGRVILENIEIVIFSLLILMMQKI